MKARMPRKRKKEYIKSRGRRIYLLNIKRQQLINDRKYVQASAVLMSMTSLTAREVCAKVRNAATEFNKALAKLSAISYFQE